MTARELLLGVLAGGALRIYRRPDPIPTLFNEISLTRRRQAQISHPGFGRSFERVPTQGEAVTKGNPGGKHPTGKGAVRSPASGSPRLPGRRPGIEKEAAGISTGARPPLVVNYPKVRMGLKRDLCFCIFRLGKIFARSLS